METLKQSRIDTRILDGHMICRAVEKVEMDDGR